MIYMHFESPPTPHFISAGEALYRRGDRHKKRSSIGVFDMLFVVSGRLYLMEENQHYIIDENQLLILSPDKIIKDINCVILRRNSTGCIWVVQAPTMNPNTFILLKRLSINHYSAIQCFILLFLNTYSLPRKKGNF